MALDLVYIPLDQLTVDEKNAKIHNSEDLKVIEKSIRKYQFCDPVGVWGEHNLIVEGHGRYYACKNLGIKQIPCIRLDHLTDKQRQEYALIHNKSTMLTGFNEDILREVLPNLDLDEFDIDWGINLDDEIEIEEVTVPELPDEPKSKLGEVYQLGEHRLMCGDSTSETDVNKLMDGSNADMLLTDPPYNVAVENSKGLTIENDNMDKAAFAEFIDKAMANNSLKAGGAFYVWYGDCSDVEFRQACFNHGLTIRQCLIWVKNAFTLGRQDYQWRHEPCLYGWKDGAAHYFVDDRSQDTVIEDKIDLNALKKDELKALCKELLDDNHATTIMRADKPVRDSEHPTMKPIKLLARLLKNSSKRGELVLDLFGGSGSTLIACEQLGRKCYMMEYDSRYVDVIIERWEKYTGKKCIKLP